MKIILGAVFMFAGLSVLSGRRQNMKRAKSSKLWPSVMGQIRTSEIKEHISDDLYKPVIGYDYKVDDKKYNNYTIAFDMEGVSMQLKKAQRIQLSYPVGSQVQVFYDPADPSISTLEHSTKWAQYSIFFCILMALSGFGLLCWGLYEKLH